MNVDSSIKLVQIVRAALIVSIALYLLIGEQAARRGPGASSSFYLAFTVIAISTIMAIMAVRRVLVLRAERTLATQPLDAAARQRWRAGYIVTYALSETVALYGFVLRMMGFSLSQVLPFYAVSLILMMFFSPRRPVSEIG